VKKVLLFLVVVGLGAWLFDSSGIGIPRSVPVDPDWARQTHAKQPTAIYVKYNGTEYVIDDSTQVHNAVDALGERETRKRFSLFGKPLPDTPEKKPNEIWIKFPGKPYEKIIDFADPQDYLGKQTTYWLNDDVAGKSFPPPPGFSLTSS